mmetsp:Transcript_10036/g.14631  ORF Transcript_10036/g.14631 Transcript_10036/m.14631 type:complete len:247 (-) Transcript_10036:365-1105(-)
MVSFRLLFSLATIAGSAMACTDDATYQITLPNSQSPPQLQVVGCSYIKANTKKTSIRIANLCPAHSAKCPFSCGTCPTTSSPAPSSAPQASPSAKPSAAPQASPSAKPSGSTAPSAAPFGSPSAKPSQSMKPTVSCTDSATYTFKTFSGKMEKCSWMTKNPNATKDAARILKYCADAQTKFQCAKTCSNCRGCADDEGHTFVLPNVGKTVNCSYITKNFKRTATRRKNLCPLQGQACPKSCGYCPA